MHNAKQHSSATHLPTTEQMEPWLDLRLMPDWTFPMVLALRDPVFITPTSRWWDLPPAAIPAPFFFTPDRVAKQNQICLLICQLSSCASSLLCMVASLSSFSLSQPGRPSDRKHFVSISLFICHLAFSNEVLGGFITQNTLTCRSSWCVHVCEWEREKGTHSRIPVLMFVKWCVCVWMCASLAASLYSLHITCQGPCVGACQREYSTPLRNNSHSRERVRRKVKLQVTYCMWSLDSKNRSRARAAGDCEIRSSCSNQSIFRIIHEVICCLLPRSRRIERVEGEMWRKMETHEQFAICAVLHFTRLAVLYFLGEVRVGN